jgi:N-acetylglutamate synthase-like GNAT family acetyltransferase
MNIPVVEIVPFEVIHQRGVDVLYQSIEEEFPEQVFPDTAVSITALSRSAARMYWVALADGKVVGTAGVIFLNDNCCGLKSMFLAKEFRGNKTGIAENLLQKAINKAKEHGCKSICLGTMEQFKAAQRFYEKHGFERVTQNHLPVDFPANNVDTVFYRKTPLPGL